MSRGRGRGRGGGFGGNALLPMGLTFADIQNMSREGTALYPPMRPPPLHEYSDAEKKICRYQLDLISRLRQSQYHVVESVKSTELPRYSDKYRPSANKRPSLRKSELHAPFFPADIFETYFNPRKKQKDRLNPKRRLKVDDLAIDDEDDQDKNAEDGSDVGSQAPSDYDVEEEYDNDYAENYFDNGEGEDMDDLGAGDEGGGGDYD